MTRRPPLTIEDILSLADAWHARTGRWPQANDTPEWKSIHSSLRYGWRGLCGGTSLAQLLAERRGAPYQPLLPRLTVRLILEWAQAHQRRTRKWPNARSGPVTEAPSETWACINSALTQGLRGLPRGPSLAQLLTEHLGVRTRAATPPLAVEQILAWADAHNLREGKWPNALSGPIHDAPDETWRAINLALEQGWRGLPGGDSLSRLLRRERPGSRRPKSAS
jgi:hypothetical protein